jgi:catechol 2,3-dioxygenase-like lactoylglutathione lyase family enzyme
MRLHHVQVACPSGGEPGARRFYGEGLGLIEVEKPEDLRARGGCWFRADGDGGAVLAEIHVGVEEPFAPARKAHPALLLADAAELERTGARLTGLGFDVDWSQRDSFPGYLRFHTFDAHGNRVEILAGPSIHAGQA